MRRGEPGARDRILERVARATGSRARHSHPGRLRTDTVTDPVATFVKRFTSQGGEVVTPDPHQPPGDWLTGFITGLDGDVKGVAVGADVPAALQPRTPGAAPADAGAGISVAWGAVAETGTLILPSTGSRSVQLLPPVHIVWVPAGRVFARLEDALLEMRPELPAAIGLHSGPSRSADIGRTLVTGVHGPGRCIAVWLRGRRADL